ncbi:MAG TPA: hypothetical protein VHG27_05775 [Xanthobacteraceae bacterium]|nr:hypothetical protein [Xanthobacteraceae bacterium]
MWSLFWGLVVVGIAVAVAEAKPARCFTTDDGNYDCRFVATDRDGSFEISARGKPTYVLTTIEPGVATGFVNLGARNVALPGRFLRSKRDRACWENDTTGVRICAW